MVYRERESGLVEFGRKISMARLMDLVVGSVVDGFGVEGVLIAKTMPHPRHRSLMLAVWCLMPVNRAWWLTFDALNPRQDVGTVVRVMTGDEMWQKIYKVAWSPTVPEIQCQR